MKVGYTHHMSIILSWIDAQLDFDQFDFISLAFPDASSPSARAFNTWEVLNDEGRWQEVPLAIMARPVPPQLSWPGPWPRPYEFLAGASFSPGKMITCGFAIKQWNLNLCQVCFTYMFVVSVVCRHSIHSLGSSWCMMFGHAKYAKLQVFESDAGCQVTTSCFLNWILLADLPMHSTCDLT